MADYDRDQHKGDNAAKTLAIIALIVSLLALIWAVKADNRAGDALDKAERSSTTSVLEGAQ